MKASTIDDRIQKCYDEIYSRCLDGFSNAGCYNNFGFDAASSWKYIRLHGIKFANDDKIRVPFEFYYIDENILEDCLKKATKGTRSHWVFANVKMPYEFEKLEGKEKLAAEFMYNNWQEYNKELEIICEKATNKKVFDAFYKLLVEKYKKFMKKVNPDRDTISANVYLGPSPTSSKDVFERNISDFRAIIDNIKIKENLDLEYIKSEMDRIISGSSNREMLLVAVLYYISHVTDRELVDVENYSYYEW